MGKQKLDHLQSLRGVAALLVVWHHSSFLFGDACVFSVLGATGVPLFFIVSGFIMVYTSRTIPDNKLMYAKEFAIKRIIRIIPLFYFTVLVWLVICRKDVELSTHWMNLLNTLIFHPQFTAGGPDYGLWLLGVNWTLNYEIFFYGLFALSLIFAEKRYYFLYVIFFLLLIILPLLINGAVPLTPKTYVLYGFEYFNLMSNPILLYFVIGITLGLCIEKMSMYVQNQFLATGYYLFSVVFFLLYFFRIIPSEFGFEIIACTLLTSSAILMDYNSRTFKMPSFMVYLGNISYSIYLMHTVVYLYVPSLAKRFGMDGILISWYGFVIALAIIIALSSLTYYIIEKRLTDYLRIKLL